MEVPVRGLPFAVRCLAAWRRMATHAGNGLLVATTARTVLVQQPLGDSPNLSPGPPGVPPLAPAVPGLGPPVLAAAVVSIVGRESGLTLSRAALAAAYGVTEGRVREACRRVRPLIGGEGDDAAP